MLLPPHVQAIQLQSFITSIHTVTTMGILCSCCVLIVVCCEKITKLKMPCTLPTPTKSPVVQITPQTEDDRKITCTTPDHIWSQPQYGDMEYCTHSCTNNHTGTYAPILTCYPLCFMHSGHSLIDVPTTRNVVQWHWAIGMHTQI